MRKKVVHPTAPGELLHRLRQGAVGLLQVAEGLVAPFIAIGVEHYEARRCPRGNGHIRLGPCLPPAADGRLIGRGMVLPRFDARMFADVLTVGTPAGTPLLGRAVTGEDMPAFRRIGQCPVKRGEGHGSVSSTVSSSA